ncbi:hypothetical protein OIU83_02820 [Flavobacterium sp. LS1R49]|uniref:Uncharacterized protein n=1 Tax=Flavobacterium shii TaxID=2987687 RepID=A0A9X2ZC28_9FLAO|nr:hypothetical protein [Flavobacterium shii]MCV9926565.1 hypothetical protein [Flavobacterium shii]
MNLFYKYIPVILAFLGSFSAIYLASYKKIREIEADLKHIREFKQIDLEYKRAEFIYTQKHNGYENLLKIISKYSKETHDLIFEDFLLTVFEFNSEKNKSYNNELESTSELELFYEKFQENFSSISKKYNDLYHLLNIEIQPSILNSSDEVYELIENVKNNYNSIFKKFTNDFLPKFTTLTLEEMEKHNSEIKDFSEKYHLSFNQLKTQMRKEIKEEQEKINKTIPRLNS